MNAPATTPLDARKARTLILDGKPSLHGWTLDGALELAKSAKLTRLPDGITATHIDLSECVSLRELPAGMTAISIDLSGCVNLRALPADLKARRIGLSGCAALAELPAGLRCNELDLSGSGVRGLPASLRVDNRIDLSGCASLRELPAGLKVGTLVLRNCPAITRLPEGLEVSFLDISGCTGLRDWPATGSISVGRLNASGCVRLRSLPPWLTSLSQLNVSGCASLEQLPEGLEVNSWLDIGDSGITGLPASLRDARLRWRGVPVSHRIAFQPEAITADEILEEANSELRRVLIERMGYEAFLDQAGAKVLDRDRDPGGERRLLRMDIGDDEPLVCLAVNCPSTARRYILRVPPATRSCRQAAAWIAGFDNADDYRPLIET